MNSRPFITFYNHNPHSQTTVRVKYSSREREQQVAREGGSYLLVTETSFSEGFITSN